MSNLGASCARPCTTLFCLWGLIWPTGHAVAEQTAVSATEEDAELKEMVVVANRIARPLNELGVSVSVLDRDDLESHGNVTLDTVLQQLPSTGLSRAGGPGAAASIRIRGEENFRTLFIIDGLRLGDPAGTHITQQPEHLLSAGVHRVEVLRGPQGMAYGGDAGGVVRIQSLGRDIEPGVRLSAERGSHGQQLADLQMRGNAGRVAVALGASRLSSDGINQRLDDVQSADRDGYHNRTVHAALGHRPAQGFGWQWTGRQVDAESAFDGCFTGAEVAHDCVTDYGLSAQRLALHHVHDRVSHELSWSRVGTDRQNQSAGQQVFSAKGTLERWDYLGALEQNEDLHWVFGADYQKASNRQIERSNRGLFAEALYAVSTNTHLGAGLRYDDNDDFGGHGTWRVTLSHGVMLGERKLRFRSAMGSGFRAPSPYETAYNLSEHARPPASMSTLGEETSLGLEAGVDLMDAGYDMGVTVFRQEIHDAIEFDLAGYSGYLQRNGESRSQGVELTASRKLGREWLLSGNYTYNDTTTPEGQQRLRRPRQQFNLGFRYAPTGGRMSAGIWYRAWRDAVDESRGRRQGLAPMNVVDMNFSWQFSSALNLYLRTTNLLDDDYRQIIGYRVPGRGVQLGFRVHLQQ